LTSKVSAGRPGWVKSPIYDRMPIRVTLEGLLRQKSIGDFCAIARP